MTRRAAWQAACGKLVIICCRCCHGCGGSTCCAHLYVAAIRQKEIIISISSLWSYSWPHRTEAESLRLLNDPALAPTHCLMGGEFMASMRRAFEAKGHLAISVHLTGVLPRRMHFQGDLCVALRSSLSDLEDQWRVAFFGRHVRSR